MFKKIDRQSVHGNKKADGHMMRWLYWFDGYEQNEHLYIKRPRTNPLTSFPTQAVRFWFFMTNNEGGTTAFEYNMKSREPRGYDKWGDYIAADFPAVFEDAKLILLTELRPYLVWRDYAFIGWTADTQILNPYTSAEAFRCEGYSRTARGFFRHKENE